MSDGYFIGFMTFLCAVAMAFAADALIAISRTLKEIHECLKKE